jgi:hypothetical protein
MLVAIFLLVLPICSLTMGLFGFFVGRCARKLPIIDNHLPWTMLRSQLPRHRPGPGIKTAQDTMPLRLFFPPAPEGARAAPVPAV